jgi:hypothetical protein
MSPSLKRLLAVGVAAAVAFVGPVAMPQAQAKTVPTPVAKASGWLVANPATADDGYTGLVNSTVGLAVLDTKAGAATVRSQLAKLSEGAKANVPGNAGRAATMTILARIMHLNPKSFGGVNLIKELKATVTSDGQVGSFGSAYGQALAIIAFKRAGQKVPANVVTKLLSFQDASGAFGYEYPAGTFNADPDSTALAIQALDLAGHQKKAVTKAVGWANKNQTKDGYWAAYSPVDTTSLMATALKQVHHGYGKARSWLLTQQLTDGGFAAELRTSTSTSNLLATANASYLLVGKSLAKVSYQLKGYAKSPRPKITGTPRVGQKLTAVTGTWSPKPAFSYQWYRSGHKIKGATADSYTLVAKDRGKHIRVRVLATGMGLKSHHEYSKYTHKVKKALAG